MKILLNKSYDVISSARDATSKILSRDSNYIADAVTWPKLGNSSMSTREVIVYNLKFIRT